MIFHKKKIRKFLLNNFFFLLILCATLLINFYMICPKFIFQDLFLYCTKKVPEYHNQFWYFQHGGETHFLVLAQTLIQAYVMPYHTVTLKSCNEKTLHHNINWSAQHFKSFIYSAIHSAIWRQKAEAPSREVQTIYDTMAQLSVLKSGQKL